MRKTIILILLNFNLICMAQTRDPEVLFEQQNINVLLEQNEDSKTYLTQVTIYTPANLTIFWGSEMNEKEFQERNIEFSMVFHCSEISKKSQQEIISIAYFSKDIMTYKIYETGYLNNWAWRESENHPWVPMSYEASMGKCVYTGNSDNEELLAVKVWKYVNKHQKSSEQADFNTIKSGK